MTKYIQNLINEGLLEEAFNILHVDPENYTIKQKNLTQSKRKVWKIARQLSLQVLPTKWPKPMHKKIAIMVIALARV